MVRAPFYFSACWRFFAHRNRDRFVMGFVFLLFEAHEIAVQYIFGVPIMSWA